MHFNQLDYVIVLLPSVSGIIGILRGFIKEILQLTNLLLSIFIAFFFRKKLMFLFNFIASDIIKETLGTILLFIALFISGNIIIYLIYQTIKIQGFGKFLDKILGLKYGILRGLFLVIIGVMLIENNYNFTNNDWWQNSVLLGNIQQLSTKFTKLIPSSWREKIEQLQE